MARAAGEQDQLKQPNNIGGTGRKVKEDKFLIMLRSYGRKVKEDKLDMRIIEDEHRG